MLILVFSHLRLRITKILWCEKFFFISNTMWSYQVIDCSMKSSRIKSLLRKQKKTKKCWIFFVFAKPCIILFTCSIPHMFSESTHETVANPVKLNVIVAPKSLSLSYYLLDEQFQRCNLQERKTAIRNRNILLIWKSNTNT